MRLPRFRLRTLMVAVAVVAVPLGVYENERVKRRRVEYRAVSVSHFDLALETEALLWPRGSAIVRDGKIVAFVFCGAEYYAEIESRSAKMRRSGRDTSAVGGITYRWPTNTTTPPAAPGSPSHPTRPRPDSLPTGTYSF